MLDKLYPCVVALGYFDCVHIGHKQVIETAKTLAEKLNAGLVVFTFDGNLRAQLGGDKNYSVYLPNERENLLVNLGADKVFFAPVTQKFLSLTPAEFLQNLNALFNIKGYACGMDYKFGKGANGSVSTLKEYAQANNQQVSVAKDQTAFNQKVSTTFIKSLLGGGEIEKANLLLTEPYFITGEVFKDRGVGKSLGFPTANIKIDLNKQPLKQGVYYGNAIVDNVAYKAVINYGSRPTFNEENKVIEAHILSFNGDIYGKKIKVSFIKYLRDIIQFGSVEDLKRQLITDIRKVEDFND